MARTWLTTVLTGLLLLISSPQRGPAQVPLFPDEFERLDVIAIERDKRDLLGFDALTGSRSVFRLDVGETILFEQTRGRVGLVLTDRRALGIAPGAGFQAVRYSVHEDPPISALVDERIAIVVTPKRVLGFLESGPLWVEEAIPPSERVQALRVGAAVGVVSTNRRALGLSTTVQRFVGEDLSVRERLEAISAQDTLVTLRTTRRILVFSSRRGTWTESDLKIR